MSNPWFRLYTEAVDDEKLRLLAFEDRWHFVALLCCKGKGLLDQEDQGLMRRKVAVKLGLDSRAMDEVMRRLAEVGLIDEQTLQPLAWDRRQYESDHDPTATDRKRRQRARQHQSQHVTEQSRVTCHDVTHVSRPPDTDTDTDTEKDSQHESVVVGGVGGASPPPGADAPTPPRKPTTSKKILEPFPACPDWLPSDIWQAFINHRHTKRKPLSAKAAELTLRDLQKAKAFGHDPVVLIEAAIANGWTGCVFPEKHFQPAQPIGVTHANGYRRPLSVPERFAENLQGLREPIYDDRGNQVNPNYRPI